MRRNFVFLASLGLFWFLVKDLALAEAIRVGIPGLSAEFAPVKMGIELLGKERPASFRRFKDYVDPSLMSELEKSGFLQSLYK
jgi:hypothetical protein